MKNDWRALPTVAEIEAAIASEDSARAKLRAAVQANACLLTTARALYVIASALGTNLGVPGVEIARQIIDVALAEVEGKST